MKVAAGRPAKLSTRASRTSEPPIGTLMAQALTIPGVVSLAAGFVDQESLPAAEVLSAAQVVLSDPARGKAALQYSSTMGDLGLRRDWMRRLEREDGITPATHNFSEEHVIITNGSQQLLKLVSEALLDPGDIVIVEAPTYFVYLGIIESLGARAVSVDCDAQGLVPDSLRAALQTLRRSGDLSRLKLVYCMSYFTNPMGVNLSGERREELYSILEELDESGETVYLLEDAAYRPLRYDGPDLPSIKTRDTGNEFVIYTQTFSKAFSPGFKLGFGLLPDALVAPVRRLKGNADFGTSNFTMQLAEELLRSGAVDRHAAELREMYRRKRDLFRQAIHEEFPEGVVTVDPAGGLYVWAQLPGAIDTGPEGPLFAAALEEKVLYVPGRFCFAPDRDAGPPARSSMRLSFGLPAPDAMVEGVARLGRAVRRVL
ncbi:PLP-dependent aminotransferase family protein [bacterium]|nr:PLP-dependent aminotransferase family protein [bacterium]